MLTKTKVLGTITILPDRSIQVRKDMVISEDGVELSRTYSRYVLAPGDDISRRDDLIKDLAVLLWTPEVLAAAKARKDALLAQFPSTPPLPGTPTP
jgi:hypothetical protein